MGGIISPHASIEESLTTSYLHSVCASKAEDVCRFWITHCMTTKSREERLAANCTEFDSDGTYWNQMLNFEGQLLTLTNNAVVIYASTVELILYSLKEKRIGGHPMLKNTVSM